MLGSNRGIWPNSAENDYIDWMMRCQTRLAFYKIYTSVLSSGGICQCGGIKCNSKKSGGLKGILLGGQTAQLAVITISIDRSSAK
jgi:hypothetical protein